MTKQITLIRHGQAGSRTLYDQLSPVGEQQSTVLGKWFASRGTHFDVVISGALSRQQATAKAIAAETGHELIIDARWNEFDLDLVYAGLAGPLCRDDERFRAEFEQLQRDMEDPAHHVHRAWRNCDTTVVKAWIAGRYEFEGETFAAFVQRIADAWRALPQAAVISNSIAAGSANSIAVITSATPIGLVCGKVLDLAPAKIMQMAAAIFNTAYSEFELTAANSASLSSDSYSSESFHSKLVSFNNITHLPREMKTVR